jgi:AcrR family transcriptional regulator
LSTISRPLRADAARNREKVLDAAHAAFGALGHEAQMEDIARRAGVGVGTVYRHFPTKAALLAALADRRWQAIIGRLDAEAVPHADPWGGFRQMFVIAGEAHERDRGFAEVAAELTGQLPGPPTEVQGELNARVREVLDRAHAAGALRADVALTDLFPIFCSLAAINRFGAGDWRRYLELVLDGLRAR